MEPDYGKQLKIKTGAVRRTYKEYMSYQKEAEKQRQKVQKMEEDKKDEYDIKAQKKVLDETLLMLPHTKTRLEGMVEDLTECMGDIPAESPVKASAEYKTAEDLLTEVNNYLKKP